MKVIPQNALVVMVGPSGAGKSTIAAKHFGKYDVVSSDNLREELLGDFKRQDSAVEVFGEFHRRLALRIQMGRLAVADATHIRGGDRKKTAYIGRDLGVPVVYLVVNRPVGAKNATAGWRKDVVTPKGSLIEVHDATFQANEKTILAGDGGLADLVIDTRVDEFTVAQPLPRDPQSVLPFLVDRGYDTIRVIGDVHGNLDGLNKVVGGKNVFHLFLGDIVDYGRGTLRTLEIVHDMVSYGRAINIRANHEKKIGKWLDWQTNTDPNKGAYRGTLSHGNDVTANQFLAMGAEDQRRWAGKFRNLVAMSPDFIMFDVGKDRKTGWRYGFAHGAATAKMYQDPMFRFLPNTLFEKLAMFGETVDNEEVIGHDGKSYPMRTYNWVNELPARTVSVVGHAVRSTEAPLVETNDQGGTAIFLDTGSSKDGKLSFMDLMIEGKNGDFRVERKFGDEHSV